MLTLLTAIEKSAGRICSSEAGFTESHHLRRCIIKYTPHKGVQGGTSPKISGENHLVTFSPSKPHASPQANKHLREVLHHWPEVGEVLPPSA